MRDVEIAGRSLADRVFVVAEIGNNHEGDAARAREMVEAAAAAGVDAVKFQTFRTEGFISSADADRFRQLKGFELSREDFAELADLARERGVAFVSTPLDLESAEFLEPLADAIKIASSDNSFERLVRQAAAGERPLIVSTGLAGEPEVARIVEVVEDVRGERAGLVLLHCVTAYPAPIEAVNLRAIPALAERFDHPIGYSDHTLGIEASVLAVALGARMIEKHFTLGGIESEFRDHALSADEAEMAELVRRVREAEAMLGERRKSVQPQEAEIAEAVRRSIAAARELPEGHVVAESDLAWVRPGVGIPPGEEERVVGRRLRRAVAAGELFDDDAFAPER